MRGKCKVAEVRYFLVHACGAFVVGRTCLPTCMSSFATASGRRVVGGPSSTAYCSESTKHTQTVPLIPRPFVIMSNKPMIVAFKDDASKDDIDAQLKDIESKGGKLVKHFAGDVIKGFSAEIPSDHVSTLEQHPAVQFVEPDSEIKTQ